MPVLQKFIFRHSSTVVVPVQVKKGKRNGRELLALEITLFQYRKGEGRERERERGGGGGMSMRGSLGEVLTEGRNVVVAGHRPLTPYTHPAPDPLFRPL